MLHRWQGLKYTTEGRQRYISLQLRGCCTSFSFKHVSVTYLKHSSLLDTVEASLDQAYTSGFPKISLRFATFFHQPLLGWHLRFLRSIILIPPLPYLLIDGHVQLQYHLLRLRSQQWSAVRPRLSKIMGAIPAHIRSAGAWSVL